MKKGLTTGLTTGIFMFGMVGMANAAAFTFDGNITYHNDVIEIGFTLDSNATDVRVWTDSFMDGTNFDPITAVWERNGSGWDLLDENDDNYVIGPFQTDYDSGLTFTTMAAGDYLFTIATYDNFAIGNTLSEGFEYDAETPVLMANWTQPANDLGMGTYYRVNLDGVDSAQNNTDVIPEPGTMLLMGTGLLGLMGYSRKRFNKKS